MSGNPVHRLDAALEGRYRVEGELGEGGMATVYLAEDLRHGRRVALKVLKPDLAAVVGAERFLSEIRTTAHLQHPHILPLFESGEADGLLFYVMPYVEGESLRQRLDRVRQLPVDEALRITAEVADALAYAHGEGIVHRDIKPGNILLKDNHCLVADFGIALALDAAGGERLTRTGVGAGTPDYMSPEQALGDSVVGPSSDVYSLGCVLYELLTGARPHAGTSPQAVLAHLLTREPDRVRDHRASVPEHVDGAVRKALERLPADRFSSVAAFAAALSDPGFRYGEASREPGGTAAGSWRPALMGAAATAALAVALLGLRGSQPASPLVLGPLSKVTFEPGLELTPVLSPDGQEVAYRHMASGRILIRGIDGGAAVDASTEPLGPARAPAWSPDGTTLLLEASTPGRPRASAGEGIFEVSGRGGAPRLVATAPGGVRSGAWSSDGTRFAYVAVGENADTIRVRSRDGTIDQPLAEVWRADELRWSPDDRWIAFSEGAHQWSRGARNVGNIEPSAVRLARVDDGWVGEVTGLDNQNLSPAWLPDGRLLFVSDRDGARDIYVVTIAAEGAPGPPVRVTTGLRPHGIHVSADGRRLAYSSLVRRQNVHVLEIPEAGVVSAYDAAAVTRGEQVIEGIAISPDGEWIAYDSNQRGNQDVYRRRLSGGEPVVLAASPEPDFVRSWSRDGRWIAGHAFRQGQRDAFVADRDGLAVDFFDADSTEQRYPDISPDGDRLVLDVSDGSGRELRISTRGAGGEWSRAELLVANGRIPRWSPDGTEIAYVTSSFDEVRITDPAGTWRTVVSETGSGGISSVEWYDDGRRLLVLRDDGDGRSAVWTVRPDGSGLEERIRFDDPVRQPRSELAVHGDRVFFTINEVEGDVWVVDLEGASR